MRLALVKKVVEAVAAAETGNFSFEDSDLLSDFS